LVNLSDNSSDVEKVILPFLYRNGITRLNSLILSDGKAEDRKLSELLSEIKVKEVWMDIDSASISQKPFNHETRLRDLRELNQLLGRVKVFSIYPDRKTEGGTEVESPLLVVSYEKFKLLLSYDFLPESTIFELRPNLISLSPQGANASNIEHLALNRGVKSLVISGHDRINPSDSLEDRVLRTSRLGAVIIKVDSKKFEISSVLGGRKINQSL
jgi:hypothetical protein